MKILSLTALLLALLSTPAFAVGGPSILEPNATLDEKIGDELEKALPQCEAKALEMVGKIIPVALHNKKLVLAPFSEIKKSWSANPRIRRFYDHELNRNVSSFNWSANPGSDAYDELNLTLFVSDGQNTEPAYAKIKSKLSLTTLQDEIKTIDSAYDSHGNQLSPRKRLHTITKNLSLNLDLFSTIKNARTDLEIVNIYLAFIDESSDILLQIEGLKTKLRTNKINSETYYNKILDLREKHANLTAAKDALDQLAATCASVTMSEEL